MTEHDLALLERLRFEPGSIAVVADEPDAVAAALTDAGSGRRIEPAELVAWADEADVLRRRADAVLAAEDVVAGAEAFERDRRAALLARRAGGGVDPREDQAAADAPRGGDDEEPDGLAADRHAVRFALAILVPAQLGGLAVYAADRTLVAVLAPAGALVFVLAVAIAHRPRRGAGAAAAGRSDPVASAPSHPPTPGTPVPEVSSAAMSPAVRAAQAHLRRQEAAWKLAWWERGLAPVDVATWVGRRGRDEHPQDRATLVVVDGAAEVADEVLARMTAALPAAVRIVLIRSRLV